ncbi:MAG: beta strand repeat-containing protein, partial [Burkholderiaceae bacterium]
ISAQGDLLVEAGALVQAVHLRLASREGDLQVAKPSNFPVGTQQPHSGDSLKYGRSVSFVAPAGTVDLYRFFNADGAIEYRAGVRFLFGTDDSNRTGLVPGNLTSDSIILETGEVLSLNGTISARKRLELISARDVLLSGNLAHRDGGTARIEQVTLIAKGLQPILSAVNLYGSAVNQLTQVSQLSGHVRVDTISFPVSTFELRALRDVEVRVGLRQPELTGRDRNLTLSGFVGGLQGFGKAENVNLVVHGTLTVVGGIIGASKDIDIRASEITSDGASVFIADQLDVRASNSIQVNTLVESVTAVSEVSGNISINEADNLYAELVAAESGSIDVAAGGYLWARDVYNVADGTSLATRKNITLSAARDLYVDRVEAAVSAGAQKVYNSVVLDARGLVRELPALKLDANQQPVQTNWKELVNASTGAPVTNTQWIVNDDTNADAFGFNVQIRQDDTQFAFTQLASASDRGSATGGGFELRITDSTLAPTAPSAQVQSSLLSTGSTLPPPVAGDVVLIIPELPAGRSFPGLSVGGDLSVVALPTVPGQTLTLSAGSPTADGDLVVVDGINVGSGVTGGRVVLSAQSGGIALGGEVVARELDITTKESLAITSRVDQLAIQMTGPGDVSVTQDGNLTLSSLQMAGGDLALTVDGDLTINSISGTGGEVTLFVTGSVNFGATVTPAQVELITVVASGAISGRINATSLALDTDGPVTLVNTGSRPLAIESMETDQSVSVQTQGNLTLSGPITLALQQSLSLRSVAGAIEVQSPVSTTGSLGSVTLDAGNGLSVSDGIALSTTAAAITLDAGLGQLVMGGSTSISSGTGKITLEAGGNIVLGRLLSDHSQLAISSGGSVGSAVETGQTIVAPQATVQIDTVLGVGSLNAPLETSVAGLNINNTGTGAIYLADLGTLDIQAINQTNGNVVIESRGGALTVSGEVTVARGDLNLRGSGLDSRVQLMGDLRLTAGNAAIASDNADIVFGADLLIAGDGSIALDAPEGSVLVAPAQSGWIRDAVVNVSTGAPPYDERIDWVIRQAKFSLAVAGADQVSQSLQSQSTTGPRAINLSPLAPDIVDSGATFEITITRGAVVQRFGVQVEFDPTTSQAVIQSRIASQLAAAINAARDGLGQPIFSATAAAHVLTITSGTDGAEIAFSARGALRSVIAASDTNARLEGVTDGMILRPADAPRLYSASGQVVIRAKGEIGQRIGTEGGLVNDGVFTTRFVRLPSDDSDGLLASPLALVVDATNITVESAEREDIALITPRSASLNAGGASGGYVDLVNLDRSVSTSTVINGPVDAAGEDVLLVSNRLEIGQPVRSTGAVLGIRPTAPELPITLESAGGGSGLSLNLAEIARLQEGFKRIEIGSMDGAHRIAVTTDVSFRDPLVLMTPQPGGEVTVDRSALRAPTMTIIGSGHTTYLDNSSLTATEGAMDIFDSVVVQGTSSITSPTYIDIQRAPAVSGSGSINANPAGTAPDILNLTAGGLIRVEGPVGNVDPLDKLVIVNATDVTFEQSVVVDGDLIINATGSVKFEGSVTINNGGSLRVIGANQVAFSGGQVVLNKNSTTNVSGDLYLETNLLTLPALDNSVMAMGTGSILTMRPTDPGRQILLFSPAGTPTVSSLDLSTNLMDKISSSSFDKIVVGHQTAGRAVGTARMVVGAVDTAEQYSVLTDIELYAGEITFSDYSNPSYVFAVSETLKIDAVNTIEFRNEVESLGAMSIWSASGQVRQVVPASNLDLRATEAIRSASL